MVFSVHFCEKKAVNDNNCKHAMLVVFKVLVMWYYMGCEYTSHQSSVQGMTNFPSPKGKKKTCTL